MTALFGGKLLELNPGAQDDFVRVRKRDLEKLTTEVMQLREFLPSILNGDLTGMLHKAQRAETKKEHLVQEQEQLRRECWHLQSRLDAVQTECQKEREEKLLLREQLWQSGTELQRQADFCSGLGSAACNLLWSCSAREDTVTLWLTDGKLQSFLNVAAQTLESFLKSLEEHDDVKTQTEDHNSHEHQFLLALVGTVTNIAAVPCGRDYLSSSGHVLLDTLMKLLELMKSGVFPKLKVLMLMALYNVSISVRGLKYIGEKKGLVALIRTMLDDGHWEVCLHSLRLLQSVLLEEDVLRLLGSLLLDPGLQARIGHFTLSVQPSLRATARQTLEDLQAIQQAWPVIDRWSRVDYASSVQSPSCVILSSCQFPAFELRVQSVGEKFVGQTLRLQIEILTEWFMYFFILTGILLCKCQVKGFIVGISAVTRFPGRSDWQASGVRTGNRIPAGIITNIGTPQGCVLSPILYNSGVEEYIILKFADDTALVEDITGEDAAAYRREVATLVIWCGNNYLTLNTDKTKEMIVNISKDLIWTLNNTQLVKKAQQRLAFLRKFGMSPKILSNFHGCVVESILTSCHHGPQTPAEW
ncbi:heat shock factor 2-binding protein [Xenentodon cancila]